MQVTHYVTPRAAGKTTRAIKELLSDNKVILLVPDMQTKQHVTQLLRFMLCKPDVLDRVFSIDNVVRQESQTQFRLRNVMQKFGTKHIVFDNITLCKHENVQKLRGNIVWKGIETVTLFSSPVKFFNSDSLTYLQYLANEDYRKARMYDQFLKDIHTPEKYKAFKSDVMVLNDYFLNPNVAKIVETNLTTLPIFRKLGDYGMFSSDYSYDRYQLDFEGKFVKPNPSARKQSYGRKEGKEAEKEERRNVVRSLSVSRRGIY